MATTKRFYIFATFLLSCVAAALLATSIATESWVNAQIRSRETSFEGVVTYGLYSGILDKQITQTGRRVWDLYLTCELKWDECVWSCQPDVNVRKFELTLLHTNGSYCGTCLEASSGKVNNGSSSCDFKNPTGEPNKIFFKGSFWIATLAFLALGLTLTVISGLLGIVNTASNPTFTIFSVMGLFYWNSAAGVINLLILILWGSHFSTVLQHNIGLTELIANEVTLQGATMGYSYWLVLAALLVSFSNVVVLAIREYFLRKEPPKINIEENADGLIFLY